MLTKTNFQTRLGYHILIFITSFLIIFSRRPDTILNPQFWAEDGHIWYAEAYNKSFFTTLITPVAGYFQTISRLVAGVAQLIPLNTAPLFFNLVAITFKALVVNILMSGRFNKIIPNIFLRTTLAFVYLALPNSYEVHANLTNAQWHLALLTCLIIFASPGSRLIWQIFDLVFVMLSVLSGPLCLFLLPIAVIQYQRTKQRWTLYLLCIILSGVIIQSFSLVYLTGLILNRTDNVGLGATFELFLKIFGGQVVFASLVGQNQYIEIFIHNNWTLLPAVITSIIGFLAISYAFWKGTTELRMFLIFSGLIFAGSLVSPVVTATQPQWQVLWQPTVGNRYWFIPMMGFILSVFLIVFKTEKWYLRLCAAFLLVILSSGIIRDWSLTPFEDFHFQEEAEKVAAVPSGTEVEIPINPKPWTMKITKK